MPNSWLVIVTLVALRLGIGWQFFMEGADKIQSQKPYSAGFFANAKGPLAPLFKSMIWDADGLARLDRDGTIEAWTLYRERAGKHYGFDEKQSARAQQALDRYKSQLRQFFADNGEAIQEYRLQLDRRKRDQTDRSMAEVASLNAQVKKREGELSRMRQPWLATIDRMWQGYERELNELATQGQSGGGRYELEKPGRQFLDTIFVDQTIQYFDVIVGAGLILGLLTRAASVLGALFMCSVMATQPPGFEGSAPIYYQLNLTLGLLLLAATGAGRFAGLDFFVCRLRSCCCPAKRGKNDESDA